MFNLSFELLIYRILASESYTDFRSQLLSMSSGTSQGTLRAAYPFFTFRWNAEFLQRRSLDYTTYDESYLEWLAVTFRDHDGPLFESRDDQERSLTNFMDASKGSQICGSTADLVICLCLESDFNKIRTGAMDPGKSPKIAWFDEKTFLEGKVLPKRESKPLTASEFYKDLRKPVRPHPAQRFDCGESS